MKYYIIKVYDHVMTDPRFNNLEEKIIYCHVLSWEMDKKTCFSSDNVLGDLIGQPASVARDIVKDLERRKILKQVYPIGGQSRWIRTTRVLEPNTERFLKDIFEI